MADFIFVREGCSLVWEEIRREGFDVRLFDRNIRDKKRASTWKWG